MAFRPLKENAMVDLAALMKAVQGSLATMELILPMQLVDIIIVAVEYAALGRFDQGKMGNLERQEMAVRATLQVVVVADITVAAARAFQIIIINVVQEVLPMFLGFIQQILKN